MRTIPALDGVRGLAIGLVVLFHELPEVGPGGAVGVDVFFALSSFLITSLLLSELRAHGSIDYVSFYWRRAFRLGPALALFLLVVAPTCAVLAGRATEIGLGTVSSLFYVTDIAQAAGLYPQGSSYAHTWSLAVEEQFYLVWPAVVALLYRYRRSRWWYLKLLCAGAVAAAGASELLLGTGPTYFLPFGHLPALAAGVAASACFMRVHRPWTLLSNRWVAIASVTVIVVWTLRPGEPYMPLPWRIAYGLLVSVALFALLTHLAITTTGPTVAALVTRPIRWLGERSYGVYLYSGALHAATVAVPLRRSVVSFLEVALVLLIAEASYRMIEKPVLRRGREWLARRRSGVDRV